MRLKRYDLRFTYHVSRITYHVSRLPEYACRNASATLPSTSYVKQTHIYSSYEGKYRKLSNSGETFCLVCRIERI